MDRDDSRIHIDPARQRPAKARRDGDMDEPAPPPAVRHSLWKWV
jgi:hypothetical protein